MRPTGRRALQPRPACPASRCRILRRPPGRRIPPEDTTPTMSEQNGARLRATSLTAAIMFVVVGAARGVLKARKGRGPG